MQGTGNNDNHTMNSLQQPILENQVIRDSNPTKSLGRPHENQAALTRFRSWNTLPLQQQPPRRRTHPPRWETPDRTQTNPAHDASRADRALSYGLCG